MVSGLRFNHAKAAGHRESALTCDPAPYTQQPTRSFPTRCRGAEFIRCLVTCKLVSVCRVFIRVRSPVKSLTDCCSLLLHYPLQSCYGANWRVLSHANRLTGVCSGSHGHGASGNSWKKYEKSWIRIDLRVKLKVVSSVHVSSC
jgi:hypothetical protein